MSKSRVGKVILSGRELTHEGKTYDVAGAHATIETDGAVVERFTATRILLLGVFALAFKKKKDKRGLYLLVDGPDYAFVAELDPKKDSLPARQMAQEINVAGMKYASFSAHGEAMGGAPVVAGRALANALHVEGYMIEVNWDGETLHAHGTNKMSQVALSGAGHASDVVLAAADIASIDFKPATAMTNGTMTIGGSDGKSYELHFRRKSGDDFARLRDSLLGVDGSPEPVSPALPPSPAEETLVPTPLPGPTAAPVAPVAPPGWHPDPHGVARLRYWDGAMWTEHIAE